MAVSNSPSIQNISISKINVNASFIKAFQPIITPELIAILDFLPLLDLDNKNTPAGEIVDLRASAFKRNRNFIRRKFRGLFRADLGDESPDTLETLSDNSKERKLIDEAAIGRLGGIWRYRALAANFDYYTDTSFQAVELLFSTSEIFMGAFDRIKNYSVAFDNYDLADDISSYITDLHYDVGSINTNTHSGIVDDEEGYHPDLFRKIINSLDQLVDHIELGDFDVMSTLPTYFKEGSLKNTNDTINAMPTSDKIEGISFLFFTLGKAYARKTLDNKSSATGISGYDVQEFIDNFKNVIGPENNYGYNLFREESVENEYKGSSEFLNDVFEDTVKNKKTSFDVSKIMHLRQEISTNIYLFTHLFYYSYGFFTENKFINDFYRKCGSIMSDIFPDDNDEELIDDLFIRILKSEPGGAVGLKEVAGYYDDYYRQAHEVMGTGMFVNSLNPFDEFKEELYKKSDHHDYNNKAIKEANNNSYIFSAVKELNEKWGDGTQETETCILLIVLNIISIVAQADYVEIDKDTRGAKKTKYYTNLKDDLSWEMSTTFDNGMSNKTSNDLYNNLRDIYLRCASQHYSVLRRIAGLKSVEVVISKIASDIGAIKYLNNEALAAAAQHSHLLLDYNYKHAFRVRQFFDLLQQHEMRFTPQKFNLSKDGGYELLKSFMTQDKCKMSKKQQLNRKKKIFSIGIRNNAIKQAINNSEEISGDYTIKLKVLIEKELAVFDGIKFKPLEFEFNLSSFAALNSYEIAGLTNSNERELLFETTDEIINSVSFDRFILDNMKLVKFKNSFSGIEDFMHVDTISAPDKIIKNGIESDILKEYIYRIYGIDMSETTFIPDRKGADLGAQNIITSELDNRFKNTQSLMLNKSIFFNGDKFTYEILQNSKFEKIINVLVDVENDFEVDTENLELNDWSNVYLLNDVSTADHYDFKIRTEIVIEEAD
jgi:hypothetical protein